MIECLISVLSPKMICICITALFNGVISSMRQDLKLVSGSQPFFLFFILKHWKHADEMLCCNALSVSCTTYSAAQY